MNNHKIIVIATGVLLLISFIFLSAIERKQANINNTNIWMTYFENPKDNSLNFIIENHSNDNNFHWQVLADKSIVSQGDQTVSIGENKTISINTADTFNKKMTVSVTSGSTKKEIYKNL